MRGTEVEAPVGPVDEEERRSGFLGLAVIVGLLVWLGVQGGLAALVIVLAIVAVVFLHELGHYLTAKWAGMKVTEFFLGAGPRLWSFRRGETEYGVKAIPVLAYVRIIGMSNLDDVDPADEARTYRAKSYWRRMSVAVAGSAVHFVLAFLLLFVALAGFGEQREDVWSLRSVSGPALQAGLEPGDEIVSIDGREVTTFAAMSRYVRAHPGERVEIVAERDGATRTVSVVLAERNPTTDEAVGFLGVGPQYDLVRQNPLSALGETITQLPVDGKDVIVNLGKLFSPSGIERYVDILGDSTSDEPGETPATDRPSSVIGVVQIGAEAAEQGIVNVVMLLYVFNLFIGIFNMTPLLPFDGGHAVIATYEKIREMISGRPYRADVAKLLPVTYAVVLVLGLLFISTLYLDIFDPIDLG